MKASRRYTLTLSCPDRVGIVAAVSGFFAQHGGWIVEASYHADTPTGRFFMRQEVLADTLPFDVAGLRTKFGAVALEFAMDWQVSTSWRIKKRPVGVSAW